MRKAVGLDRRRDPHRVLGVLQEIDADIVALQEADKRVGGRGSAVPHELIDSHGLYKPVHLGVRHKRAFDKVRKHTDRLLKVDTRNIGWHGNAILVKPHVGVLDCAALDLPTLEPRGAVIAELLIGEQPLRVVGMHLDLSGLWRKRQLRAILDEIRRRPQKMPTILMGDTNEWRTAPGASAISGPNSSSPRQGRASMPATRSRSSTASSSTSDLKVEAAGVHMSPCARRASDHLPIWARVYRLAGDLPQPTALDRGADSHRFAIFDDGAPGDVEAALLQQGRDRVVAQDVGFGADQFLDRRFHRFRRRPVASRRRRRQSRRNI